MSFLARAMLLILASLSFGAAAHAEQRWIADGTIFETSFLSSRAYADPFNDVEVDVVFERGSEQWRVPAFWAGDQRWTVRFHPPAPGRYRYHLESNDRANPDLNGQAASLVAKRYAGSNPLLARGFPKVSANGRYFVHGDGTPFIWLGDVMWSNLSSRLSWGSFRELVDDRVKKGYTVVQICAGLVPNNEEAPPGDPGFANEGGPVWSGNFDRINPAYFDYADRRIDYLIAKGITPVITGGWRQVLAQIGVPKMKQHWRYVIARYSAYPVFWMSGGEIYDPAPSTEADTKPRSGPEGVAHGFLKGVLETRGWTDVLRYLKAIDPYKHPATSHEVDPPFDTSAEDERLKDYDMFQAGHRGWPSIATAVALIDMHYARTKVIRPLIMSEIGFEQNFGAHYEDFQRMAYWESMLNGAAGFTYGTLVTSEAYDWSKPLHRSITSFLEWREGMTMPGSYQVGIASKLFRTFEWEKFAPHPEWVTPGGTTLLEPQDKIADFDIDLIAAIAELKTNPNALLPAGEWRRRNGNFRLPYAAGTPGEARLIYLPGPGRIDLVTVPTILALESGVTYDAAYWEPSLGVTVDLGQVTKPADGPILFSDSFIQAGLGGWKIDGGGAVKGGRLVLDKAGTALIAKPLPADFRLSADLDPARPAALIARYRDTTNYVAARWDPAARELRIEASSRGKNEVLGRVTAPALAGPSARMTIELRGNAMIAAIASGDVRSVTPIVARADEVGGSAGLLASDQGQSFGTVEVRGLTVLKPGRARNAALIDAEGRSRNRSGAPAPWDALYSVPKQLLLDAYLPPAPPFVQDWVLILKRAPAVSEQAIARPTP